MPEFTYLRPNIKVEPLIDQWYAWPHLIPPATAARNLTERHLKIMESYVVAPHVHAAATKSPKMRGGPFIDYGGEQVDAIRNLCANTKRSRTKLIELSEALNQLDALLKAEAKGFCLQSLYEKIPKPLKGYIELFYDLNNNPGFRLIEPLLYRSSYYDAGAQTLTLSEIKGDDRPFILSTPRLHSSDAVHLQIPFNSRVVDELFSMKTCAKSLTTIRDQIPSPVVEEQLLASFFTTEHPHKYIRFNGSGVRWRYFGHACILIETARTAIMLDPVLSYTYESHISRYTYQDLPDYIDYVLITHDHQDHILFETLLQLRHKVGAFIVPRNNTGALQDPSLKLMLEAIGFNNVIEMSEFEALKVSGLEITALPFLGEHADLHILSKLTYLVQTNKSSLLFAADSCNFEPEIYRNLAQYIGNVDVLFLGMECDGAPLSWLYGPLLTRHLDRAADHSRRLAGSNCEQACDLIESVKCKEVYVYAMGQEPWLNYVMSIKYSDTSRPIIESNQLIQYCHKKGITAERLYGEKEILIDAQ
jgi:L-ascorbate metabolism protein UlaG (beta-lactamase superfamily)